jgi:hypothetical protein
MDINEIKTEFAAAFLSAYNSLMTNRRFPRVVYAILGENGHITGFDDIAKIYQNCLGDSEYVVADLDGVEIGDGWDRNDDGTIEETDENIAAMLECLMPWGAMEWLNLDGTINETP